MKNILLFLILIVLSSCEEQPRPRPKSVVVKSIKNKGIVVSKTDGVGFYQDYYTITTRSDSDLISETVTQNQYFYINVGDTIK
jgi:subtilase family serine protease